MVQRDTPEGTPGGALRIWQPVTAESGQCLLWQIGPLDLRVRRTVHEWHVTSALHSERTDILAGPEPCPASEEFAWRRWAAQADEQQVRLQPVLPERAVVVRPDAPLVISKGHEALFFVSIPVWVRVTVGGKTETVLCEEKSIVLSNSWMGSPTEGELVYALRTRAKRAVEDLDLYPHRAVCPVEIRNTADSDLLVERLCLRAQNLNVYQGKQHLWTNAGRITRQDEGDEARVVYARSAPAMDPDARLVGPAREPPERHSVLRSFGAFLMEAAS